MNHVYQIYLSYGYNTALHCSIKCTPFFLTYGVEPRLPSMPTPDVKHYYGQSDVAEWFATLQHCRQISAEHNMHASDQMQAQFYRKASPYNYVVNQLVWLDERNFLGRNRKISPNWTGPYRILQVFHNGVVELQLPNRKLRTNVARIKPYIAPIQERSIDLPPVSDFHCRSLDQTQGDPNILLGDPTTFFPPLPPAVNRPRPCPPPSLPLPPLFPAARPQPLPGTVPPMSHPPVIAPPPPSHRLLTLPTPNLNLQLLFLTDKNVTTLPSTLPPSTTVLRNPLSQPQMPLCPAAACFFPSSLPAGVQPKPALIVPQFLQRAPPCTQPQPLPPLPPTLRVTRSLARANNIPLSPPMALINKKNPFMFHQSVAFGTSYVSDELGLPIIRQRHTEPLWVTNRRKFLKKLSVSEQNRLLTGDPAFCFDTVPYDGTFTHLNYFPTAAPAAPPPLPLVPPLQRPPAPAPQPLFAQYGAYTPARGRPQRSHSPPAPIRPFEPVYRPPPPS
jgi:hypothetical protein